MLKVYSCKICNLGKTTKQHYDAHCLTLKHINNNKIKNGVCIDYDDDYCFICINCSKKFKSNKGLWQHKKKCFKNIRDMVIISIPNQQNPDIIDENIVIKLLNSLNLIQKKIIFDYLK
jgi:hypothetical protein